MRVRPISLIVLAALLSLFVGCDEVDSPAVTEIGVTRLLFVDPGVRGQSVSEDDDTIQVAKWAVLSAEMTFGSEVVDLTFGGSCSFDVTSFVLPQANGNCEAGVVVPSSDDPVQVHLDLELTMTMHRARPLPLPTGLDYEGDAVPNESDNCPLIPNPDQRDADGDGVGDACSLSDSLGRFFADNDGDGVTDLNDNCLWFANLAQLDTQGLTSKGLPDGIGDACVEEIAEVRTMGTGSARISLSLPLDDFFQPQGGVTYLVVDFDNLATLVSCDWNAGTCQIDESLVTACEGLSVLGSSVGCPEKIGARR